MDPEINSDIISHFSFNITHCTKGCFMAKAKSSKPASPAAYGNDSISQLMESKDYTDVLFLFNAAGFAGETAIARLLV